MNENCLRCEAIDRCSVACEYGSIACNIRRIISGQKKGDAIEPCINKTEKAFCSYCGKPLKYTKVQYADGRKAAIKVCSDVRCCNYMKAVNDD